MGASEIQTGLRPQQVLLLRLFKRIGVVVLALAWLDRPAGEGEIAAILDIDRSTAHAYLSSLLELGIVRRSQMKRSYSLTPGGEEILSGQVQGFSASQAAPPRILPEGRPAEDEKNGPRSTEESGIRVRQNLAAFRAQGVGANRRVRRACALEHVSPQFIQAQAGRLRAEGRFSPGLLLLVVESNDPPPRAESDLEDDAGRQRYVSGRFADHIQH